MPHEGAEHRERLQRELRAEHLPPAVDQVVGFVDQKDRSGDRPLLRGGILRLRLPYIADQSVSSGCIPEEAAQLRARIEDMVVIADHDVREQRQIQGQLKRTDLEAVRAGGDRLPGEIVRFGQQAHEGLVHPVEMPVRPRTGGGVAGRMVQDTDALSGCQDQGAAAQSLPAEKAHGVRGDCPRDRLGGQIEDPVRLALPHRLQAGEQDRQRLAGAGGRLQKELPAVADRVVDMYGQLPLALPVRKRELQRTQGVCPDPPPADFRGRPLRVSFEQVRGVGFQLLPLLLLCEIPLIPVLQPHVGHAHAHALQAVLAEPDPGVHLRLRHMDRHRFFHAPDIPVGRLDLIDGPRVPQKREGGIRAVEDPVRASLQEEFRLLPLQDQRHTHRKGDLRLIAGALLPLDLPVHARAFEHDFLRRTAPALLQISGPEHELHKLSH